MAAQVGIVLGVLAMLAVLTAAVLSCLVSWRKLQTPPVVAAHVTNALLQLEAKDVELARGIARVKAEMDERFADLQAERVRNLVQLRKEINNLDRHIIAIASKLNVALPADHPID